MPRALLGAARRWGLGPASAWLNAHVRHDASLDPGGPPAVLAQRVAERGLPDDTVAMMTGAAMTTLRVASADIEYERFTLVLTAGLSNARAAGRYRRAAWSARAGGPVGTINIALFASARLADAALVETIAIIAEALAATLRAAGIESLVSGRFATGMGSDASAVFCAAGGPTIEYAGKHTIVGETIGRLVMAALTASLAASMAGAPGTRHAG